MFKDKGNDIISLSQCVALSNWWLRAISNQIMGLKFSLIDMESFL
jgi:hypothetical protein